MAGHGNLRIHKIHSYLPSCTLLPLQQHLAPRLTKRNRRRLLQLEPSYRGARGSAQARAVAHAAAPRADLNQLQTQLGVAVAAEDYAEAARIKRAIADAHGGAAPPPRSWADLNIPHWLVDRAERLGFLFPNAVQQEAAQSLMLGADAVIRSETGSGKTLAFLLPALSLLEYPPVTYASVAFYAFVCESCLLSERDAQARVSAAPLGAHVPQPHHNVLTSAWCETALVLAGTQMISRARKRSSSCRTAS